MEINDIIFKINVKWIIKVGFVLIKIFEIKF